jgi:signal transduction histidine kinase
VREAVERLGPDLQRSGSEVRVTAEGDVRGWWDALRLDQIVVNLLSNAIKFGQGRPIEVRLQRRGDAVLLSVKDQGLGITPEARARLFRKYERAVPTQHYGGLGLGLYISRMLAEAMGGTIEVASQPGQGSTFTVSLPREPELG